MDDLIILSNDLKLKNDLKDKLKSTFKMKDLGTAEHVLGIKITRDRNLGTISIDQSQYIQEVLERFGMADCAPVSTPVDVNQKLTLEMSPKGESGQKSMANVPYQEAVAICSWFGESL